MNLYLARLESNEDLFTKATEGIVFTHNNKTYKLTGLFTPINRLRGFFRSAMGREGFGKASLPGTDVDKPDMDSMLSEIIKHAVNRRITEGGNAFRPRDARGKPTGPPVTTDERIPRALATKIEKEVVENVIKPLGLDYLPVGSTATDKKEIGDVDLTVSEPDTKKLVAGLKSLPYLKEELVEGIPRILELPGGRAATIMIDHKGKYYQVDLFTSNNIEDTAWELSGGGEGQVRGEYHKLMLSLLAKIKGERESTSDKLVKYTVSFPGGLRERINGKESPDGRIIDPDLYLPEIGIDVSKETIRTFGQLIDYMSSVDKEEFKEAFQRFEGYIENRINSKSEAVRSAAKKAMSVLQSKQTAAINEKNMRKIIKQVFKEQDASRDLNIDISDNEASTSSQKEFEKEVEDFARASSWAAKTRAVQDILSSPEYLGKDFEKVIGGKSSLRLMRFGLKSGAQDRHDFSQMMNNLYDLLSPDSRDQVRELAPNEGKNPSGSYTAYFLPDANVLVLFGIAGVTGGQRKAGYEYEINVRDQLEDSGIDAAGGEDNSVSDIYVPTAASDSEGRPEMLGIEVKLPNAQAGEPTLAYDFDTGSFLATNPKAQNQDIANLINADPSREKVRERLAKVRDAINAFRKDRPDDGIESILRRISREEYVNVVQPVLSDNPIEDGTAKIKGALLAVYTVSASTLRKYYMLKQAGLVQVKGKGLFHLHPDFKISLGTNRETKLFDFNDAQGSVYFRNFRGGNYGIRSQLTKSPLKTLPVSGVDLDKKEDRTDFIKIVKGSTYPSPKSIVRQEDESSPGEDQISETLRNLIRKIL